MSASPVSLSSEGSAGVVRRGRLAEGAERAASGVLADGVGVGVGVGAGVGVTGGAATRSCAKAGSASATASGTIHSLLARILTRSDIGLDGRHRHFARLSGQQDQSANDKHDDNDEKHDSGHRSWASTFRCRVIQMGFCPSLTTAV